MSEQTARGEATHDSARVSAVLAGMFVLIIGLAACGAATETQSEGPTFDFLIPAGAGEQIDAGEPLDILPAQLVAELDDTIQIVNRDDRAHLVGPWFVGPGETLRQRFNVAGVFEGSCSVHPSGGLTVTVNA